jgi:streptomycin 6-kinase
MFYIPNELKTMMLARGENGKQWLNELSKVIEALETKWDIEVTRAFPNCYCNYVAEAKTRGGEQVVLKIGFPDDEFIREVAYLKELHGIAVPRIINLDMSLNAVLMEKIEPAKTLVAVHEDEAISIAASLMKKLWKPIPSKHNFIDTDFQYADFIRLSDGVNALNLLSEKVIEQAKQAYEFLKSTRQEEVLLHGDLHHYNILHDQERGWTAIDPVGVIGERGYEFTAFLKNPPNIGHETDLKGILTNRIDQFSRLLDIETKRLLLWGQFQSALATLWASEDGTKIASPFAKVASTLATIEL